MPFVKLSEANQNLELYYEVHGSGQIKILFIMGLLTDGAAWCCQVSFTFNFFITKILYLDGFFQATTLLSSK